MFSIFLTRNCLANNEPLADQLSYQPACQWLITRCAFCASGKPYGHMSFSQCIFNSYIVCVVKESGRVVELARDCFDKFLAHLPRMFLTLPPRDIYLLDHQSMLHRLGGQCASKDCVQNRCEETPLLAGSEVVTRHHSRMQSIYCHLWNF